MFVLIQYFSYIMDNPFQIWNNYGAGKNMNFTPLQHEAYLMAFLESLHNPSISPLNKIHYDVVVNGKEVSPNFFSMLLTMLQIRDDKFGQILNILTTSITLMHQNPPDLVQEFFQSEGFQMQFMSINKMMRELWLLMKEFPSQRQEWNIKQNRLLDFKTKVLCFLESHFSCEWVQIFKERSDLQMGEMETKEAK